MKTKRKEGCSRRITTGLLSAAVATAVLGLAPPVQASHLPTLHYIELSDPVLASMRGKFVSHGRIVYFGVQMITQFTTEAGASFRGGLYVGFHHGVSSFQPTMTVLSKAEANDNGATSSGPAEAGNIQAGGLSRVTGVSQSVQVTGNGNAAGNQVTVNVSDKSANTGPSGSGWQPGTMQVDSGAGQVRTQIGNGSAGITVSVPGQGVARQTIANALGLQQQLQLGGSLNRVMNQMQLDVAVQGATAQTIARQGVDNALASLRNLAVGGRF